MSEVIHVPASGFPERYDDLARGGQIRLGAFNADDPTRFPRHDSPEDVSPLEVLLARCDEDAER